MKIINKETGRERIFETRQQVLLNLLAPIKDEFSLVSRTYKDILEKYKDVPLTPYKMTESDLKKIASDPDYIMDIPKFHVKGFDEEVSSTKFDQKICDEFYERFSNQDKKLFVWINKNNPTFKIEY